MSDQKNKPVLDEQTFGKLLESAFVLQEHYRKMQALEASLESQSELLREQELANQALVEASEPESESEQNARENDDYTLTLAEIVEAQHQIQIRHLELDKALAVVAERVARITNASGAGIGILDEATVRYRAGAGSPALAVGTAVPLQTAVCQASVRTGQVIRTEDLDTEFLFDPEPCRKRGIRSLLAVPIYYDGDIAGALELYFARIRGFVEEDIHTCQLMAGLVTEALARDAGSTLRKSTVVEHSAVLTASERLQPKLAALADHQSSADTSPDMSARTFGVTSSCWKCGAKLLAEEVFCGTCGAPSTSDAEAPTMQSKLAAAWPMLPVNGQSPRTVPANGSAPRVDSSKRSTPESSSPPQLNPGQKPVQSAGPVAASDHQTALTESSSSEQSIDKHNVSALVKSPQDIAWGSVAKTQDFLESLAAIRSPGAFVRFWRSRRGDFYLALAVVLVAVVLGWGVWSSHPVSATDSGSAVSRSANRKRPAPDADLSAFDKFLIALGLADPPETPEYRGNPDTQVWVDPNTALYYCPGSDLYAKTAKGKLTSQRDAQLDQFEPASRRACD